MAGSAAPVVLDTQRGGLAEVWGDTVDLGHLGKAVVIGGVVSLACFFVASHILAAIVSKPDIARAYAMLAGLGGCLVGGAICARLFAPKREVVEHSAASLWQEEVLAQLIAESGTLGSVSDLPAATAREMKELDLYDLFASHGRTDMGGAGQALPSRAAGAEP